MYNVTYDELLGRMLARVPDKFDKREGSVIFDALSPAAVELQNCYIELNRVIAESYADSASREYLILRCKERGIFPYEATNAVLKGVFTPAGIDVTGKRFNIGSVNYVVTEKITDGEYKVQCESPGIVGNQYLGAMIPIEYIEGLETAEITEVLIPGEDDEDTESLRKRYFGSFNIRAFGGNRADYIEKVSAVAGVGGVKVTRVWNGDIKPAELVPAESVLAWFESNLGSFSEDVGAWLTKITAAATSGKLTAGGCVLVTILNSEYNTASAALIERVKETLDPADSAGEGMGVLPIGHVVTVQSAVGVPVDVTAKITFEEGFGWDNLGTAIDNAVSEYLLELRKSWQNTGSIVVRISQIETRILGNKGVLDIADTTLNGVPANLALGAYEVPVFGKAASNE